jgi:hypothetical protein
MELLSNFGQKNTRRSGYQKVVLLERIFEVQLTTIGIVPAFATKSLQRLPLFSFVTTVLGHTDASCNGTTLASVTYAATVIEVSSAAAW